jgi:murein DD-endopeptidase MepM/ murein hydrolase activator NlpD
MAGIAHVLHAAAALTIAVSAAVPPASAAASGWTWPVRGEVLADYRNGGDPYAGGHHRGIDIASAVGEPVIAAAGGTVRFAGVAGSSGLTVSLRTSDGLFDTSYLHLADVDVREGERVASGERIGAVGTSGKRSSVAPHLHFGVREAGSRHSYRDPRGLLPGPPTPRERPRGVPVPVRSPVPVVSLSRPEPIGERVPVPVRRPVLGPAPAPVRAPSLVLEPAPRLAPQPRNGLDPGWALACAFGLLAAAALVGGASRSSSGRARSGGWPVARLLPLLARR